MEFIHQKNEHWSRLFKLLLSVQISPSQIKKSYLMCNTPKILGSPNTFIQSTLPTLKTTQVQSAVWVKEAGLEPEPNWTNRHLHDGSDDAEPRPGTSGNGIVRTCAADRHFGLEGGHALRHPGCQGELFPQLKTVLSLTNKHFSMFLSFTGILFQEVTMGVSIWKILRRVSRFVSDFCVCYNYIVCV